MIFVCPACAVGAHARCAGRVRAGGRRRSCTCSHGAEPMVVRPTDPRLAGGGVVVAPGLPGGEILLDTRRCVLLEDIEAAELENPSDDRRLVTLCLSGRINRTTEGSTVMYVADIDRAGRVVAQLVDLAGRMGAGEPFQAAVRAELDRLARVPS